MKKSESNKNHFQNSKKMMDTETFIMFKTSLFQKPDMKIPEKPAKMNLQFNYMNNCISLLNMRGMGFPQLATMFRKFEDDTKIKIEVTRQISEKENENDKGITFSFIIQLSDNTKIQISIKNNRKIKHLINEIFKQSKILKEDEMELNCFGVTLEEEKKIEEYKLDDDFVILQKKKRIHETREFNKNCENEKEKKAEVKSQGGYNDRGDLYYPGKEFIIPEWFNLAI